MLRRHFLGSTGLALGATSLASLGAKASPAAPLSAKPDQQPGAFSIAPGDWKTLRELFPLTRDYIQLSTFLLASHPTPVSDAIERHRRGFDENPSDYYGQHYRSMDNTIADAAARYMGGEGRNYALTDSTTMGLGLVYGSIQLNQADEILHTLHEHYSSDTALAFCAKRTGASLRKIALYDDPAEANADDMVQRLKQAITDKTRLIAVTWVHSSSGVKVPVRQMADEIATVNAKRKLQDQIIFSVDGVHGLGIENQDVSALGCDFFVAGTHKWMFGPRGTGVVWGNDRAWQRCTPSIPSFSPSFYAWLGLYKQEDVEPAQHMTPGGFHSFEHRWALPEAFDLHSQLGKANVQARIHQLNSQAKEGLSKMPHVRLYTPKSTDISSGFVCFDVDGIKPNEVVKRMHNKGIIMSSAPYRVSYARFAPSLLNNEAEIDHALAQISAMQ